MYDQKLSSTNTKKDQIRSAAERLFLQNGFAATSMNAITAEAGVSKQTVYSYYAGKEELLCDVLKRLITNLTAEKLSDGNMTFNNRGELERVLNRLAQQFISSLLEPDYLALVRVIIAEMPRFPQLGKLFRATVPDQVMKSVMSILELAQAKELVDIKDLQAAVRMFVGPLLTYILLGGLLVADHPPEKPDPGDIGAIVNLFMKSIAAR